MNAWVETELQIIVKTKAVSDLIFATGKHSKIIKDALVPLLSYWQIYVTIFCQLLTTNTKSDTNQFVYYFYCT